MVERWRWDIEDRPFADRAADEVRSWFGDDAAERRRMIDEHHIDPWKPGPYKGVGPRGWRRQDDRIQDDVAERLARDPSVDASDVEVTVTEGDVMLQGSVDTRAQRRRAEDLAWSVDGVHDVQNRLRVRAGELERPAA
ncbi:MAG TPA: BON domain-containing protein [Methylomirabilota bacterium]|nr:BON domain-containing protein [Methylomirabilota bacterium]